MKICTKCNTKKDFICFGRYAKNIDGLRSHCKDCRKIESKNTRLKLGDKAKEYHKNYYLKNKAELQEYRKEYWIKNSDKIKESRIGYYKTEKYKVYNREYKRYKNSTDDLYKFRNSIRNRLKQFFKYSGIKKPCETEILIGGNFEVAKKHIESNFIEGMSWNNYGQWHIDHIKPLALAKTKDDVISLCNYTNLQPLWAKDNLIKGKVY
jgi:hypothetical protein